jgi:hypothetical protein
MNRPGDNLGVELGLAQRDKRVVTSEQLVAGIATERDLHLRACELA